MWRRMIDKIAGEKWTGKDKGGVRRSFEGLEENHDTSVTAFDIGGESVWIWLLLTASQKRHYLSRIFYVCLTVHRWYNNIDNQLDATITIY